MERGRLAWSAGYVLTALIVHHRSELRPLTTSLEKTIVVAWDELTLEPIEAAVQAAGFTLWQGPESRAVHPTSPSAFYVLYTPKLSRSAKSALLFDLEKYPQVKLLIGLTGSLLEGKNLQMCNRMFILDTV